MEHYWQNALMERAFRPEARRLARRFSASLRRRGIRKSKFAPFPVTNYAGVLGPLFNCGVRVHGQYDIVLDRTRLRADVFVS